jgi:hypothetical protein
MDLVPCAARKGDLNPNPNSNPSSNPAPAESAAEKLIAKGLVKIMGQMVPPEEMKEGGWVMPVLCCGLK